MREEQTAGHPRGLAKEPGPQGERGLGLVRSPGPGQQKTSCYKPKNHVALRGGGRNKNGTSTSCPSNLNHRRPEAAHETQPPESPPHQPEKPQLVPDLGPCRCLAAHMPLQLAEAAGPCPSSATGRAGRGAEPGLTYQEEQATDQVYTDEGAKAVQAHCLHTEASRCSETGTTRTAAFCAVPSVLSDCA